MDDLFLALHLISITTLAIGLIKPRLIFRWDNEKLSKFGYRKTVGLTFGSLALLFLVLFGITTEPSKLPQQPVIQQPQKEVTSPKPSQPKTQPPTISLPKYEKLSYGVAYNTILVSSSISIDQLKLLISELPKKLCPNPNICLINIYDDAYAARTDVDLTDEFLDFAGKHFIGQYSPFGGSAENPSPLRRYKVNGQWVNF